jgi:branched-chain amino acid transport system permease protein
MPLSCRAPGNPQAAADRHRGEWQVVMTESLLIESLLIGLGVGSVYGLVALGYNVVFRASGVFSFAQGQLVMLGGLLAYSFTSTFKTSPGLALLTAALIVGVVSIMVERSAVWPLAGDQTGLWMITTLSAGTILTEIAEYIWGPLPEQVRPYLPKGIVVIAGTNVPTSLILAFAAIIFFVALLETLERVTYVGKVLRAIAVNRSAAELAGVPVYRYQALAFLVGGIVAGLAGFLLAPVTYASVDSGQQLGLVAFACWAVGGIGSTRGLIVGAWLIGIVQTFAISRFGAQYDNISVFLALLVTLAIRPTGFFGRLAVRRA